MPFESDAQRRYLWAKKPEVAKKFAKHTEKNMTSKLAKNTITIEDIKRALENYRDN
jgi:hypothetical protein